MTGSKTWRAKHPHDCSTSGSIVHHFTACEYLDHRSKKIHLAIHIKQYLCVLLHYYLMQSANVLCFRAAEDSDADAESIPPPPRSSFQMEADLRKISRQPQSTYRYLKVASAPLTVSTCVFSLCFSSQRFINIAANQSRRLSEDLPELSGA